MYGWIMTLDAMADGDLTKWDYFGKMNAIEFLNMVQFRIVKNEQEEERRKLEELKFKRK